MLQPHIYQHPLAHQKVFAYKAYMLVRKSVWSLAGVCLCVLRHVWMHTDLHMVMSHCSSAFCLVWKSRWECIYLPLKIALPQHINIYICNCHKSVSLANVWVAKVTLGDFYWRTHKLELRNSWKKWELMATQHHYHKVSYPKFQKMKQRACW